MNISQIAHISRAKIYIFFIVLLAVTYFSPIITTGRTIWVSEFDHYIPDLHIILKGWAGLTPPLYTDLQWNGFSHHAVLHNPTWYPPIILLGILGFDAFTAAKVLLIAHFILGMIGMFLLARKYIDEKYSFLASLLFGFGPVMLNFVNAGWLTFVFGFAWMPYFFLAWFHTKDIKKQIIFSALVLAMMLHSGGVFILYYAVLFTFFVELIDSVGFINKKPCFKYKRIAFFLAVLVLFFSLTFFKIIPGIEFAKETPREIKPLTYELISQGKVNLIELPRKTIGLNIILILEIIIVYLFQKKYTSVNIVLLLFLLISTNGFLLNIAYHTIPLFKTQSANLDRVLYPAIIFMILFLLQFIQSAELGSMTKYALIILMIVFTAFYFRPLNTGDYKTEIDQNQALQYIAKDKSCCWRIWQVEEGGLSTTLNAYTTPLDIRTLFGFIGSRFYNASYTKQLIKDIGGNIDVFLKKYNIKYLLSKKPLIPPECYFFVKKFPKSSAFREHMSGQYVYQRNYSCSTYLE